MLLPRRNRACWVLFTIVAVMYGAASAAASTSYNNVSINAAAGQDSFDCKNIKADKFTFDLSRIKFPVTISSSEETPPTTTRTEISIDLCAALPKGNGPSNEECPDGTRVCMRIINEKKGEGERVVQVIPVAGASSSSGAAGDGAWSARLGEHLESAERVLELEMYGALYGDHNQRTEVDMKCDRNGAKDALPTFRRYDRAEGKLKLEWRTPFACATHMGGAGDSDDNDGTLPDKNPSSSQDAGWGFFSWFFFLIILGGIVYVGAGIWRNYNEYGVWELPNREFWREAPYIAKDMGRHIYTTVSGQGNSRGTYEPV